MMGKFRVRSKFKGKPLVYPFPLSNGKVKFISLDKKITRHVPGTPGEPPKEIVIPAATQKELEKYYELHKHMSTQVVELIEDDTNPSDGDNQKEPVSAD